MKVLAYSSKSFIKPYLEKANKGRLKIHYINERLNYETALKAAGYSAITIFSADDASGLVIEKLADLGVKFIAARSTGYDNINLRTASKVGVKVANVPNYSPDAIAEHAIALMLVLNRKLINSYQRSVNLNFDLSGLVGNNLFGKTVGVIGTGNIGSRVLKILHGFGCKILANDISPHYRFSSMYDVEYVDLNTLYSQSDIITIHTPLNRETHHMINATSIGKMKRGVIIINTARGAILKSQDILQEIIHGQIKGLGIDVFEGEDEIFFNDHSATGIANKTLKEFIAHPNILVTGHQAFLTDEALQEIANTTIENLIAWFENEQCKNEVTY